MKVLNEKQQREVTSQNLKRLLKKKNVSAAEVGRNLKVSESTARSWFNGTRYPRIKQLQALADYFGVTRSEIEGMGIDNNLDNTRNVKGDTAFIPIVSKIAPGSSVLSTENVERYFEIAKKYLPKGEVFVVKVSDDAMAPTIIAGDLVLTCSIKEVKDDDIVAVLMNGSDTIELRRAKKIDETLLLVADNHTASMATIKEGDQVLGKAVQMFRNL